MAFVQDEPQEAEAFLHFLNTFELSRPLANISDLSDGLALFEILSVVDEEYFRSATKVSLGPLDNWVLRQTNLKKLYRLLIQYFAEVLNRTTGALDVPDLQAIAREHDVGQTLSLCRLAIAAAVKSPKNESIIARIQKLGDTDQHCLMRAIEQVLAKFTEIKASSQDAIRTDDDHYYEIQSQRSRALLEKETVQKAYGALIQEHQALQASLDDITLERDDMVAKLKEKARDVDDRRNDRADASMRAEIDRLRGELQKSEDGLALAESELEKRTNVIADLNRKVEDLSTKAAEVAKLKDQVDEYRHAADKLQKTENVMEKYKRKLEESADLRRHVKSLEEQNASLVNRNSSLEEDYRKVSSFKPLLESYKSQVAELEGKHAARAKENETLKYELEQSNTRLRIAAAEREKDREALELYQERVRELELSSQRPLKTPVLENNELGTLGNHSEMTEAELYGDVGQKVQGLGSELDDAITGTTTTDLKLQIRKLQRELEAAQTNQADASRTLVLQNLLDDANRMKSRYEQDYLAAHREKLVLQNELEEIRSGRISGDGSETSIALRQRLNETVEALEELRKEHAALSVTFDAQAHELIIAKSDLNLVNKDQLEILSTLRESVSEDKAGLEADMAKLRGSVKDLTDKNRMQLEQINKMLMEKVNLQSESIGQKEKMLERERDFSDLRASVSGRDLPEDIKARLYGQQEMINELKEQYKSANEKLAKAKAFIKNQDQLFKADAAAKLSSSSAVASQEVVDQYNSQISSLQEEVSRLKRKCTDMQKIYRQEQSLMMGALNDLGTKTVRGHASGRQQQRPVPSSWLPQQRHNLGESLRR